MRSNSNNIEKLKRVMLITLIITTAFGWSTNANGDNRPLIQQITEDVTVPILNAIIRPIINPIGNTMIKNAELDREFRPKYKSPTECKKPKDVETIQKCTDHYRNARANFAKHKETVERNNNMEIIRLKKVIAARKQARDDSMNIVKKPTRQRKTQPECFEKGTSKRVSCGDDYIIEKAAYAH